MSLISYRTDDLTVLQEAVRFPDGRAVTVAETYAHRLAATFGRTSATDAVRQIGAGRKDSCGRCERGKRRLAVIAWL